VRIYCVQLSSDERFHKMAWGPTLCSPQVKRHILFMFGFVFINSKALAKASKNLTLRRSYIPEENVK